jgi:hypothetical protein
LYVIVRKVKIRTPLGVTPAINSKVAVPPPTKVKTDVGGPKTQLCGHVPRVPVNTNGLVNVRFVRLNGIVMGGPVNVNVPE